MSFCQDTKNDLCALACKSKCCKKALLYGMLLSGNVFLPEKIRLVTENEKTAHLILHLLKELYGVQGNLYVSEKKAGEGKVNSYKLTVSAREDLKTLFSDYAPEKDWEGAVCPSMFHCEDCFRLFLRGAFLTAGTITDPNAGYRLELIFENAYLASTIVELLEKYGLSPKYARRKTSHVVYIKESENVEDFLTSIGASSAALAIMEVKIMKDIRNAQNRRSNCDAANIFKMTGKAQEQIRMIRALKEAGIFELMGKELQITAQLREEHPESSLIELAELHDPPITKSGVNHRLKKIAEHYEKLKKEPEEGT
ncbi:MAG: DNA-binding protein WhiA [Clostridia bacterium]|nr:DNA-binding protein WhiA [Clostridia bacterium]